MVMQNRSDRETLYQKRPRYNKFSRFPAKSFTETIVGFQNEASKLTQLLLYNRELVGEDYKYAVSINFERRLSVEEIRNTWKAVSRKLKKRGVEALWVREPSKKNHCNYHLIVKDSGKTLETMRLIFKSAMPSRNDIASHIQVEYVKNSFTWIRYITKSKVVTEHSRDLYAGKRLLFQKGLGLNKVGVIGRFWVNSKVAMWEDIKDREKRIANRLRDPEIQKLVTHVKAFLGPDVSPRKIERQIALNFDSAGLKQWSQQISASQPDSVEKCHRKHVVTEKVEGSPCPAHIESGQSLIRLISECLCQFGKAVLLSVRLWFSARKPTTLRNKRE
jgi:hypothetical protein